VKRTWLPFLLLVAYGIAFGWTALGDGLLVFDDHPGQMFRIAHVLTVGFPPWRLNPGWWAGYAELQFYPPGFSYVGAALHYVSLTSLHVAATYQVLLWITLLLPGVTTYFLLTRVLGSPWLALPGTFVALTLSAGSRSGIEEGMRWGLVAARLGWGVLPLLALALRRLIQGKRAPIAVPLLLAAIILIHPAHAPAAAAMVLLAAWHIPGSRRARLVRAAALIGAGVGLTGFWLVPLLTHVEMALPLAWGESTIASLSLGLLRHPLVLVMIGASVVAWWMTRRPDAALSSARWLADLAPVMALVIVLDATVAQALGFHWLPADRLVDSFLFASIVSASVALASLARRWPRLPDWALALATVALCILASSIRGGSESTLSLWPGTWPNEWPKYDAVAREKGVTQLWQTLQKAPPGRVLFVRSALPLETRSDWRRPHSHVTALAPLYAGREILNGTFTHPSPLAGLLYTGSPVNQPITLLVEQRDGVTLFGRPIADLDAQRFNELVESLRVSAVVALDEDRGQVGFVADNAAFAGPTRVGPFLVYVSRAPRPTPLLTHPQAWRLTVPAHADGWAQTGLAYSPLWQGSVEGHTVALRQDDLGLLEAYLPAGGPVMLDLAHRPGTAEQIGVTLSGVSALAICGRWLRRRRAPRRALLTSDQTSGS
jgi:hypothetical protein